MSIEIRSGDQLLESKCLPCEGGVDRFSPEQSEEQLRQLDGWELADDHRKIRKSWVTRDFMAAIRFFEQVADVAESEGHHPDLHLTGYRNVQIEIWTHAIGGLSENDFILAAKIDRLPIERKAKT
jgi:4a-hydroxytetrahydrobiopterin dehydratase